MELDEKKKEAFSGRLVEILNHGALNLALGMGYELEIFEALEAAPSPLTAEELARAAGLHPRYVREWLGIMVTGDIVDLHAEEGEAERYSLPPEHAASLTRNAGAGNMGVYTQEIPLLTRIASQAVTQDFRDGQGVPFSAYPKFQDFMGELSDAKHADVLVQHFLPGVDNGKLVEELEAGIRVCDLGCGQGFALELMAKAYPNSTFTGLDNDDPSIEVAKKREAGLSNLEFVRADAAALIGDQAWKDRFDYITAFDAIHDQCRPLEALESVVHMLAPGGHFSMVDIDARTSHAGNMSHPMAPFLYTVSLLHCMPQGLCDNGLGLGMMWGRERATALLEEAGFSQVELCEMEHDSFNLHYFCRV